MARVATKEKTARFLEVRSPAGAVGLWSHHVVRTTPLTPIGNTRAALDRFLRGDIARWETFDAMKAALRAKDPPQDPSPDSSSTVHLLSPPTLSPKSPARMLQEYAAQYLGERVDAEGRGAWLAAPRWFRVWCRYARWMCDYRTATRGPDVRLGFNAPTAGATCHEGNLHRGRTFFLRTPLPNRHYFAAVVLRPGGTDWWDQIDQTNVTWTDHVYERLVIDPRGGYSWGPILADVINERVFAKDICLFELAADELFETITDPAVNGREQYCHLSTRFEFYIHDPNGSAERLYLQWAALFNPKRGKYVSCKRTHINTLEIARERKLPWAEHPVEVTRADQLPEAVREVVRTNGCLLLPADASNELRLAADHALFFVTFPDRRPDEKGGLLRGYQLPGRMYCRAPGTVRGALSPPPIERDKAQAADALARKRTLVVDTLLDRAARAVARRNALDEADARARIESVGGRATLEAAARLRGMLEGEPLKLFAPKPTAGALKLPDLSLALCFEHRLALDGSKGTLAPLVQTAKILPLEETIGSRRHCVGGAYPARRLWRPFPGGEETPVAFSPDSARILRDGNRYLLAAPVRNAHVHGDDLLFDPADAGKSVPVASYRFDSEGAVRARRNLRLRCETYDWQKVNRLARDGRLYLYALDFGADRWLADAAYAAANVAPCVFSATIPQLVGEKGGAPLPTDDAATVKLMFTINPSIPRDLRKIDGRSWRSYTNAYPEESSRPTLRWPPTTLPRPPLETRSLSASHQDDPTTIPHSSFPIPHSHQDASSTIPHSSFPIPHSHQDASSTLTPSSLLLPPSSFLLSPSSVLLTDREHLDEALAAMSYVVLPGRAPTEPGGLYRGYMLRDRVFLDDAPAAKDDSSAVNLNLQPQPPLPRKGKLLVELVQPEAAASLEKEFTDRIEADALTDAKTPRSVLTAPLRVTPDLAPLVAREFRRIVYTGTMSPHRQLIRPAREVALGLWLLSLGGRGVSPRQ